MKVVLFLCLLAFMTCEKDIINIGKCIYKAPKVQKLISDVIAAVATQDYSKLLPKIKEAIPELIQIVLSCITDTKAIEEQPKMKMTFEAFIRERKPNIYLECSKRCFIQTDDPHCVDDCFAQLYQSMSKKI